MTQPGHERIGYAEFGVWYDVVRAEVLEPALEIAMGAVQRELDDALSDRDLARIRSISGRVKSKRRTWRKISQPRYRDQISSVDDIAQVIDDLVGLRLTCTNLRDIEMVQGALESLPAQASRRRPLALDPSTERDYVDAPKASGYRGWHVNLELHRDQVAVTCELQVRTLLQDSWGELTHEDTYSNAGELPPLVEILSTRMADLLATLDDIAEDLRTELDRIDEAIVDETAQPAFSNGGPGADALAGGPGADAADLVVQRWRSLDRPIELSSLAWALQNEFGAEVSDSWFGFGTFKRFLVSAVPDGEITDGPRAYLLPPSDSAELPVHDAVDALAERDEPGSPDGIPDAAHQLRRIDRGFPLIETAQWRQLYGRLAAAWARRGPGHPSTRVLNEITRSARDEAARAGEPLSRRHLDYVAKAVFAASDDDGPLDASQIGETFASTVLDRMTELRILSVRGSTRRDEVAHWLLGG